MSDLKKYFLNNKEKTIHKWMHYFEIYEKYFYKFKNTPIKFLEIGIGGGGSLQMWKDYFGKQAQIFGIDSNKNCFYEEDQIIISIGSQEDRNFLRQFINKNGRFDIILDDGGHTMNQQIVSLEELYPTLNEGGIYMIEDIHTSYMSSHGGGFNNPNSCIEYCKKIVDQVNKRTSLDIPNTVFSNDLLSLHFYEDIIVFNKDIRSKEKYAIKTGHSITVDSKI